MVESTMRELPLADPGTPDHRSAGRFLWWLGRAQWRTIALGMALGTAWMVSQALIPAAIGAAIQHGVSERDTSALLGWAAVLLGLGLVQTITGILRHRFAVINWLSAAYRTVQLTVRQAGRLGATLPLRVAAGEVVNVGTSDVSHIGNALD